jgi:hypothetical protein
MAEEKPEEANLEDTVKKTNELICQLSERVGDDALIYFKIAEKVYSALYPKAELDQANIPDGAYFKVESYQEAGETKLKFTRITSGKKIKVPFEKDDDWTADDKMKLMGW